MIVNKFGLATGTMLALMAVSAAIGGGWILVTLFYITVLAWALDRVLPQDDGAEADTEAPEFPAGRKLSLALGVLHFPALILAVWAIGGATGHGPWERFGLVLAFGLYFGQISHPNAHELVHRSSRVLVRLGRAVYATLLYGHHASAHTRVHHLHVGTDADPSSAPAGLSFWAYAPRAWWGGLLAGWRAETDLRRRAGRIGLGPDHPYVGYTLGALASLAVAALIAGAGGVVALILVAFYAQLQILLSDYVQHYGLRRRVDAAGRVEPVGPHHAWNAPHSFSSALMLNAPRHSDHHVRPSRSYPHLLLEREEMPMLPYSMPVMAVLALLPQAWFRVMNPRAADWSEAADAPDAFDRIALERARMTRADGVSRMAARQAAVQSATAEGPRAGR